MCKLSKGFCNLACSMMFVCSNSNSGSDQQMSEHTELLSFRYEGLSTPVLGVNALDRTVCVCAAIFMGRRLLRLL